MTDWSQLTHAYGPAGDIPGLLARADPDQANPVWHELWSRLCHQGTVYPASFAALPALTELAAAWPAAQRVAPIVLAANIVASEDQPYGDVDARETYWAEVQRLRALTEETLGTERDDAAYVHLLKGLLAFEGVEVWGEQLDGLNDGEFEATCPHCEAEMYVAFGEYGTFTTQESMYMDDDVERRPLIPADPATLTGIGRRLHDRAAADGHPAVATKLTYVFGRAECVECGGRFGAGEAIAAHWLSLGE